MAHPEQAKKAVEKWHKEHPDRVKEIKSKNYRKYKEKYYAQHRERAKQDPDKRHKYDLKYRLNNQDKIRATNVAYQIKRLKTDPVYRMIQGLRSRLLTAIKRQVGAHGKKADRTLNLIGCSGAELRKYLEARFQPGMTWDNYGRKGWVVDHIRPCASFDLSDPEQQRKCFNYTNLNPMWFGSNLAKSSHWNGIRWNKQLRSQVSTTVIYNTGSDPNLLHRNKIEHNYQA